MTTVLLLAILLGVIAQIAVQIWSLRRELVPPARPRAESVAASAPVVVVRFFHTAGRVETKRLLAAAVAGRETIAWRGKRFRRTGQDGDMPLFSEVA